MVARGHIQDGVVILDEGTQLPEGQRVTVLTGNLAERHTIAMPVHSIQDIAPVSLGTMLPAASSRDDLLGEMLDGRA